ncbi:hypothetical protein W02_31350 [Nitrospira sp. KM1]|uniref:response regulator n=1 Tax=Nitrospira sp. KM1 TaxID=1936990 RepID=UPI0013A71658|nr:response regulator [Nitrospira sp. KM1]BCA55995.1 hypothetical protein W02_31350 [Nitrospira sp. KM1]
MSLPRVMLVDDDEDTLTLLTELISSEGCEIATATDAEAALRHFETWHPQLLIVDIHLPGMNGLALLEQIRAVRTDVPIILLSAGGSPQLAVEGLKAGAFDLLNKPFLINDLRLLVRRALDSTGRGLRHAPLPPP